MEPNKEENKKGKTIEERRREARLEMETKEEKKRREAEEAILLEKELVEKAKKEKEESEKKKEEAIKKAKEEEETKAQKEKREKAQKFKKEIEKIKTVGAQITQLRTFKTDMDELVREQNITMARILMEEEKKKRETGQSDTSDKSKKTVILSVSIILMLVGISLGAYVYLQRTSENNTINTTPVKKIFNSLVFSESKKEIEFEKINPEEIRSETKNSLMAVASELGKIIDIQIFKKGKEILFSSREFLQGMRFGAPDELARSLGEKFMLGAVSSQSGKSSIFIVMTSTSYQNSLAGMLRWERGSMAKDLYEILSGVPSNTELQESLFEDRVIDNQDTRILKDQNGKPAIIYGFIDTKTILIASEEDSFSEVLKRIREKPIN